MLYTIGRRDIYEPYMVADSEAAKGVTGSVWRTFVEVMAYRDSKAKEFGIYGVLADWDADTKHVVDGFRALTRAAKLVAVDEVTGLPT